MDRPPNPVPHTFDAVIEAGPRGGAFVEVPFDVEEVWGGRRIPVRAAFDDTRYRGSVAFMGGRPVLGVTRAIRDAIDRGVGDTVRVVVERDDAPRTVAVPTELAAALATRPDLRERFEGLAFTHRKEYARWVADAKKADTRNRRAARALEMLAEGSTLS